MDYKYVMPQGYDAALLATELRAALGEQFISLTTIAADQPVYIVISDDAPLAAIDDLVKAHDPAKKPVTLSVEDRLAALEAKVFG